MSGFAFIAGYQHDMVGYEQLLIGGGSGIIWSLLFIIPFIFIELLIIPYSVLLGIHYYVSSLSKQFFTPNA